MMRPTFKKKGTVGHPLWNDLHKKKSTESGWIQTINRKIGLNLGMRHYDTKPSPKQNKYSPRVQDRKTNV